MATIKNTRKIKITIYDELKPGTVVRFIEEDGLKLLVVDGQPRGTEAQIVNDKGRTYLVWTKIN